MTAPGSPPPTERLRPVDLGLHLPDALARARWRLRRGVRAFAAMRLRNKVICVALVPVVGLGGWMLLRDSSFFAVRQVRIVGLPRDAAPALERDLLAAARSQTTTDFSVSALASAVAPYTLIAGVRAQTHVPHGLTIEVTARRPLARLAVGRHRFLLGAGGMVLTGARASHLALLHAPRLPVGGRSGDPFVLMALRLIGDAPAGLRRRVVALTTPGGVLTIYLHRGPRLIFGNQVLPHAKWDAAAAVLADPSSRGASYIDVQVPWRPAAQVADVRTSGGAGTSLGLPTNAPSSASSVSTVLNPALVQPSSYTSGS